jgi:hypothetical protein
MNPKGFGDELEAFVADACSLDCGTLPSLVTAGYFVRGLAFLWLFS